jgi:biotin transport system substrate-specific component
MSFLTASLENRFSSKSFYLSFIKTLAGALLLSLISQLYIPLNPTPLTFQSATVILLGMAYGSRGGAGVIAMYLFAGALGFPVFAGLHSGIHTFLDPTAGYLIGFLPAAYVSGWLAEHGFAKTIPMSLLAAMVGAAIIFIFGLSFLTHLIGWQKAVEGGLMPFIISEPIKLIAVSCIIPTLWTSKK